MNVINKGKENTKRKNPRKITITIHGFLTRFFKQKIPKTISIKKTTLSIWNYQRDWVVYLDPIILTNKVINYLTNT